MLQLVAAQHPFVNVVGSALQNHAPIWPKPLPLIAGLRGNGVEIKVQRSVVPPTPTAHACAPGNLVQKLVHLANVPKGLRLVETCVRRRQDRWAIFWKCALSIVWKPALSFRDELRRGLPCPTHLNRFQLPSGASTVAFCSLSLLLVCEALCFLLPILF